jgi:uncharacterized protein (TIGR03118 family)
MPAGGFAQVNLASDVPGLAHVTDPNLVNPWGVAFSPTGPFWFADNGSGVSDLLDGRGQPVPLVVTIPSAARAAGTPTGTAFNGGPGFRISENGLPAPSRFLFATEDGTISGWTALEPTHALLAVDNSASGAVYTGLTLGADPAGHSFLYAADFSHGTIDVFDQDFRPVVRPFQDPHLPPAFAPFNIKNINNLLFVTYAQRDEDGREDVAGAGHGFIDVYDTDGRLVRRFASGGALNSPWGLALAPAAFAPFGGALLVANDGDGHINAFDPGSGSFLGELTDDDGTPIAIPNLWALTFGNGHAGGDSETLFFAAGVAYDEHGLFGAIQAPGRRGADTAGSGGFDPNAPGEPGDYPLPPSGGPGFRAGSEDPPIPISDLLPLRGSPLALVPTLSPLARPGTMSEAPVPAASLRGVSAQVLGGPRASLNTFLDLNTSANVARKNAGVQRPGADRQAVGAPRSPSAGRAAVAYYRAEGPSSEEQDPGAVPPSGQAEAVLAVGPPERRAESADGRAAGNEAVETPTGAGWINVINILLIVGAPLVWACLARRKTRSRQ